MSMKLYQKEEISLLWEIIQLMTGRLSWKNAKNEMNLNFRIMAKNQPLFNF